MSPGEMGGSDRPPGGVRRRRRRGPDAEWGETVVAAVVLADGSQRAEEELRPGSGTGASSKTPARIEFRASLPYNETESCSAGSEGELS